MQMPERRKRVRRKTVDGNDARAAELNIALALARRAACGKEVRQQNVRNALSARLCAAGDPARDLFGVRFLRFFLFQARLVGVRERVHIEPLARLVFKQKIVLTRPDGAHAARTADGKGAL